MKHQIPEILKSGGGAIVNMASIAGIKASKISSAYIASKHGVIGLTKAAAKEYGHLGLRVNTVCPAIIDTPMAKRISKNNEEFKKNSTKYPLGRTGTSNEVASAVLWLCSNSSSFVTGHSLVIDAVSYTHLTLPTIYSV